jgi:hypothetical protein
VLLLGELVHKNLLFLGLGKDLGIFRQSQLKLTGLRLLGRLLEDCFLQLLEGVGIVSVINVATAA